ncbi:uncharacterized protein LOC105681527 [Bombus impatiens]|uniref:Uncharacterized protein LOC105681527 n=1 Tax=Bombus impatiens TaxID=132113 RepID=A0A6P6FGG4_BOMIM|nr:uncharacterized protein LOC105681527 [Bombus impatiens]XP_024226933.1 uncharacterized protein LOC105681527 [Bombus impatiens]
MWILAFFYGFLTTAQAISTSWSPSFPTPTASALHQGTVAIFENAHSLYDAASSSLLAHHEEDRCTLYKIAMKQQLYFEYVHYKTQLPDMKEFTLCMWTKFYNHSSDHPLFSYAGERHAASFLSLSPFPFSFLLRRGRTSEKAKVPPRTFRGN